MNETASLKGALAAAEAELSEIAEQAREAGHRFRDLDANRAAKAGEVKELCRQIRENSEKR